MAPLLAAAVLSLPLTTVNGWINYELIRRSGELEANLLDKQKDDEEIQNQTELECNNNWRWWRSGNQRREVARSALLSWKCVS